MTQGNFWKWQNDNLVKNVKNGLRGQDRFLALLISPLEFPLSGHLHMLLYYPNINYKVNTIAFDYNIS